MNNFTFYSPTEFVFGKDTEEKIGSLVKKHGGTKVLVHYGGGSAIRSGLLQRVEDSLKAENIAYILLGGAQPNPLDTLIYQGIDICRKEGIDMVVAVGGGSSIDSSKAIAAGTVYEGDFWDLFTGTPITKSLKVGTVLTIPAAGSEGSNSCVITRTGGDNIIKKGTKTDIFRPVFSILNPTLTYTLPAFQTACGIADMMAHVFERYFTNTQGAEISTRIGEALLLTIIKEARIVMKDPENYDARANLMWASTMAHNGSCGVGRSEDWATHFLEHELSALYDVAHGAGLSVMFPAWMQYVMDQNLDLFVQISTRVWGISDNGNKKETALKGIQALKDFFVSLELPVTFAQLGAKEDDIELLSDNLMKNYPNGIGDFRKLYKEDAKAIYRLAL